MNRRIPPHKFQKNSLKPKVLVMGHSWVKDIEEDHRRNPVADYDLDFVYEEGVRISGLIDMIPRVMATYHTHIMLFSVLPDALSLFSIESQNPMTSQYKILGPNNDFSPEYFANQMNIFTEHCKVINPKVKIILMIPPMTDLVYHNQIRVSYFPFMIQSAYRSNPQFDERLLYKCMKDLHHSIMLLKSHQYTWMEKLVYPLQVVAQSIGILRVPLGKFMKGEVYTLGESSHLKDGFHPSSMFIEKMWGKLKITGLLSLDGNASGPRSFPNRPQAGTNTYNASSQASPLKNKASTAPVKNILKKKRLGPSPSTTPTGNKDPTSPVVSILKRPVDNKATNSNLESVDDKSKFSPVKNEESLTEEEIIENEIKDCQTSDFITLKTESAPKPVQLVNSSYMSQEIEKFASFMAGHAHAVGQNLSLRDIKQMMINALKEQL